MASRFLVIVTAKNCGGCEAFKTKFDGLNKLIHEANKYSNFQAIHVDLPGTVITPGSNSREVCDSFHPDLSRWILRYPSFYIFNQTWKNHKAKLNGRIYLARMDDNGKPHPTKRTYGYSTSEVMKWLKDVANNSSLRDYSGPRSSRGTSPKQDLSYKVPTLPNSVPARPAQPRPPVLPNANESQMPRLPELTNANVPLMPLPSASSVDARIMNPNVDSRTVRPEEIMYGFPISEEAYPNKGVSW